MLKVLMIVKLRTSESIGRSDSVWQSAKTGFKSGNSVCGAVTSRREAFWSYGIERHLPGKWNSIDKHARVISIEPGGCAQPNAWPLLDASLSSLTACSSLSLAADGRLKSGLKLGGNRPTRRRRSQVDASEFGHEGLPHSFAAFLKKLRADREFPGRRSVPTSPRAHVGQQRNKLNGRFGEAVNRLLLVGRIVST
jgi:hypothetical protein